MKRCQVCHFLADEKTPTCPKCGEASWTPGLVVEVRFLAAEKVPVRAVKFPEPTTADVVLHATATDLADVTDAELEALTAPSTTTHAKKGKR